MPRDAEHQSRVDYENRCEISDPMLVNRLQGPDALIPVVILMGFDEAYRASHPDSAKAAFGYKHTTMVALASCQPLDSTEHGVHGGQFLPARQLALR